MFSGGSPSEQSPAIVDQSVLVGEARHAYVPGEDAMQTDGQTSETAQTADDSTQSAETMTEQELVTIVEFSDFQCPACKAALPAVENVKKAYPGQVRIIYRHFPLDSIHPNARLAAIASEAAASLDESAFWPYHDRLFAEQQVWDKISSRDELKETFASYAVDLGLDRTMFLEKMEDDSIASLVNQDVAAGTQLGVNSTPTFYVNGVRASAPQLMTAVESVLNN